MLSRIKSLFTEQTGSSGARRDGDALQVAAAALLVEAAVLDEVFDENERTTIVELLARRFSLSPEEANELVDLAEEKVESSTQLHGFTRVIKDRFDHEQRLEMLEMLWEVIYSDGRLHDLEASLMRRVAGLLFVSDRESGSARKRALARLGIEG